MKRALTHLAGDGRVRMVDVSAKPASVREAVACGTIKLKPETIHAISQNQIAKGNVLAAAQLAGIQAAKRTADLIPLCHPLPLSHVAVELETLSGGVRATCTARTTAQTGVEMEALTGVAIALLAIYDMCKAIDDAMEISTVRLLKKTKRAAQARR
ncbi:MAG: cyclic pyranopterin monophosphate synthase MoaC [Chthoniobacterales bacterium]|nr:MAG: cyclic pyranopterin monophosphate synthase MoaC [Chthoniobacterales bacterium]